MSLSLYGKPVLQDHDDFSDQLKLALRKRYDGFIKARLTSQDIPYLQGLLDAGVKDANKLIQLVERHGEYDVFEQ